MERDALPLLPQTHVSAPMTMTASRCWALAQPQCGGAFYFLRPLPTAWQGDINRLCFQVAEQRRQERKLRAPKTQDSYIGLELTPEPVTEPCPRRVGDCRGQREGPQGAWPTQK